MHLATRCVKPPGVPAGFIWDFTTIMPQRVARSRTGSLRSALGSLSTLLVAGCLALTVGSTLSACGGMQKGAEWPPVAKKWFERAKHSYQNGDLEDARLSADNALAELPDEPKVRLIAADIAMAELEFERALQIIGEVPGSEAAALRGRAHWYLGNIEEAADELAELAADPDVKDAWADETLRLARAGRGRRPFEITGGIVAAVDMPFAGAAMLVPLEVNGEPALAMVATDRSESVINAASPEDSDWISLRFAGRLEVSDVPAVAEDLSGLSREMGAPIKMLIGVNLLRHLRATIDVAGRQFVVRNYEPPPPPEATTVHPIFYRGGAMVLPGAFGIERSAPRTTLLMHTSMAFPLALDQGGWKKGGQNPENFVAVPGKSGLTHGMLPMLRLGAFEIPNVPGVFGAPIEEVEKEVGIDLDGFAGSGLFATFRLTFAEEGRTLWMEDLPPDVIEMRRRLAERAAAKVAMPRGAAGKAPSQSAGSGSGGQTTPEGSALPPPASPAPTSPPPVSPRSGSPSKNPPPKK